MLHEFDLPDLCGGRSLPKALGLDGVLSGADGCFLRLTQKKSLGLCMPMGGSAVLTLQSPVHKYFC